MNKFISFFTHVKAWQLFVAILVLFSFIQYFFQFFYGDLLIKDNLIIVSIFILLMLSFLVITIGWFFSIGVFLNKIIESNVRPNRYFFYITIMFQIVNYGIYAILFFNNFFTDKSVQSQYSILMTNSNLIAFVCMIYIVYFIAKNLVIAEKKQIVSINDYYKEFILLLFYIVGIWFIQPRINRLHKKAQE